MSDEVAQRATTLGPKPSLFVYYLCCFLFGFVFCFRRNQKTLFFAPKQGCFVFCLTSPFHSLFLCLSSLLYFSLSCVLSFFTSLFLSLFLLLVLFSVFFVVVFSFFASFFAFIDFLCFLVVFLSLFFGFLFVRSCFLVCWNIANIT